MENKLFEELYSYFSDEGLTDLAAEEFFNAYKDIESPQYGELYQYLFDEGMTDLSKEEFNEKYFTEQVVEKKNLDGTPIVPGGPGSEDAPSSFTPEEEDTESPITPQETPPSSDIGEEEIIEEEPEEETVTYTATLGGDGTAETEGQNVVRTTDVTPGLNPQGEKITAIEELFGYNGFTDFFGDMYRGVEVGAAQADAVDEYMALALSNPNNISDEDVADYLEALERLESQPESKEMEQFRKVSAANGGGFMGMMVGLMQNFSIAPAVMLQSLRSMLNAYSLAAGGASAIVVGKASAAASAALASAATSFTGPGAAAAGTLAGLIGGGTGAIGGFIGGATTALEGALSFGEFFKEEIEKQDLPVNEMGVKTILQDPEAMSRIRNRALARGFTIGTVEALTFGLSKGAVTGIAKVGTEGVKKGILAGTMKGTRAIQASNISAAAAAYAIEAGGGSLGEVLGRVAADQEMDEIDIFLEGIAGTSTAPISLASGLMKVPKYKINGKFATQADIDALLKKVEDGGMTMEELASPELNIEVFNDPARKKIITDAKSYAKLGLELDPNITEFADKKLAIDLEYKKRAIKNPDLETSKETIKKIDKVLKAISNKYNGTLDAEAKAELIKEGVESPTQEQITERANAIFKRITETVDVQKLTTGSSKVGKRDESEQETTEQSQEEAEAAATETEKTEVTDQDAIDALNEEGITDPTDKQVADKKQSLQVEVDKLEEQKEPAMQRNESTETETTTKDGSKIKVAVEKVMDNLFNYQGKPITNKVARVAYNKTVNIAKRAAKAVKKILPETKIVLVEDPDTFTLLTGKPDAAGEYSVADNTIYINTSKATTATIAHEVGHAAFIQALKKSEKNITAVTTRMFESLRNSKALNNIRVTYTDTRTGKQVKETLEDYLNKFAEQYESNLQNEEKLMEAIGFLAGNFSRLDIKEQGTIRKFVNKILKALKLDRFVNEVTKTDKQIVQFMNAIAGKVASGTELTTEDLSILQEIEQEVAAEEAAAPKKKAPKKKAPKKKAPKKKAPSKKTPKAEPKPKATKKSTVKGQQEEEVVVEDATQTELQFDKELSETGTAAVGNPTEIASPEQELQNEIESIEEERDAEITAIQEEISSVKIDLKNDLIGKTKDQKIELREEAKATLDDLKFEISEIKREAKKAITQAKKDAKKGISDRSQINFRESYDLSLVKPSDKIDINALIKDIQNKKQKVWFWTADQLGSGMVDGQMMDAGPSYALQPENREKGIIWAASKSPKLINDKIKESDYIFIMSGSPTKSQLFNKKVYDAFVSKLGDFNVFKKEVLGMKKVVGLVKNILNKHEGWASLRRSPERKAFLNALVNQFDKKGTELKLLLEKQNAVIDLNKFRDGFYKANNFGMNDIMLVLKPTKAGGQSQHSTYGTDILGEVVGVPDRKVNAFNIMPTELKAKYERPLTLSEQSQAVAPYGIGVRDVELTDRQQKNFARFIDNYQINERGFMPSTVFDVGRLKREAKEFGYGVRTARFREGYRAGEISGYYLTKNGKFFNPRARYQMIDSNNPIEVIVDARKNKISDAAIKIKLRADGLSTSQIAAALENAELFADISTQVPSAFLILGDKVGRKVYNRVVDFVKKTNIENAKKKYRVSDAEMAAIADKKEKALRKKANLKSPDTIKGEVADFTARMKKKKPKLTQDELNELAVKKANDINRVQDKKLNKINEAMRKFREDQIKRNNSKPAKLTKAEIIDKAIEVLQTDPAYIDAAGKVEGKSDLQSLMVDQLIVALSTKAALDTNTKVEQAKQRIRKQTKGKVKINTKKDLFYTQTQLINLIKKTIPAAQFNKKQVKDLMAKVRDLVKPGINVEQVFNEVVAEINTINSKILQQEMTGILTKKYESKSGGVTRAKEVIGDVAARIKNILKNTLVEENKNLDIDELDNQVTKKNAQLQDRMNELEAEIKGSPENVEELVNEMADLQLAMMINSTLTLEDSSTAKVEELNSILQNLDELLIDGNTQLKLAKQAQYQAHLENINAAYEAITGEKLDLGIKENIEKAKKKIAETKTQKEQNASKIFLLSRMMTTIASGLSYFRDATSGLSLLMEKIDVLPGELFGGVMQDLVYEKINESSYAYKQFQIDNKKMLEDKAIELFVDPKFLGIKKPSFIKRRQARNALRDMNIPSNKKGGLLGRAGRKLKSMFTRAGAKEIYTTFTKGVRRDADGNPIFRDQAAVDAALADYKNAKGFFNRLRKKAILRGVMDKNVIDLSDGQTYYLYNQYKDPRNHINFENSPEIGKDHARIMRQLEESMSDELKAWADWQVNELYPFLYKRYNRVFKKLYHTNLNWNRYYAGRLYLDGVERDAVNLTGKPNIYKKDGVTSASMFDRVHHKNGIELANGNDVLSTYLTDMDWFAAYGESINQISKMFGNSVIAGAIKAKEGKFFYDTVIKIIDQIAGRGIQASGSTKFINLTNNFFLTTRLALTPILAVKQLLSTVTYIGDIGVVNWLKYAGMMTANTVTFGRFGKGFVGAAREIFANSPYMQDRYSAGFQRTLEAYDGTKETRLVGTGGQRYLQFVMDFNLFFSKLGDAGAIFLGGIPNYLYFKEQARKTNPDATEQEIIDIAIKQFQRNTKNTQQSSDLQDKDIYQMGGSALRYLNMFKTSPKQYLRNSMYSQIQLGRKIGAATKAIFQGRNPLTAMSQAGKGTFAENLRNWFLYHVTMPVTFQYVSMGLPGLLKPEFDDDDAADLARAAVLGNVNAVFILGDLIKAAADLTIGGKRYASEAGVGIPIYELYENFGKNYVKAITVKDPELKTYYAVKAFASVADMGGLPGSKGVQLFYHLDKITNGQIQDNEKLMRALGFSEYIVKQSFPKEDKMPPGLTRKEQEEWKKKQRKKTGQLTRGEQAEQLRKQRQKNRRK